MIHFKIDDSNAPAKLLNYDQVSFGEFNTIKKLVLTIEAGDIATLYVERYVEPNDNIKVSEVTSVTNDGNGPIISASKYVVEDLGEDIAITVKNASHYPTYTEKQEIIDKATLIASQVVKSEILMAKKEIKKEIEDIQNTGPIILGFKN